MHQRFCLNTATIKTTPLDLQIELARKAGFRQIGLWLKDVEAAMAQGKSLGEIKTQLDSSGLRVAEFCFLGGWQDADQTRLKEVLKQTHHICGVSRDLGCEIVVTVPALGPGWLNGASERFRQVCQVAAEYGVRIALEFPGIAADVKDLRSARELVSAAACPNGGLVIDTFHFFLGGSKVADFECGAPGEVFLVHVSDAMNLPLEKLRIPHDNRTFPGDGIIDFAPIFKQLDRLGYEGAISLEIWNRELHQSNPAEVVRKGCESLQRIERAFQHKQTAVVEG
jgi:2-keto-myo-inositol isomerase